MSAVETLSIFVCIFLITWSAGDGAPQWRPQGRFGKRFSISRNSDIMTALRSGISLCNHCCGVHWLHNQLVNNADPDETGPAGAVSSGSSLFTVADDSEQLEPLFMEGPDVDINNDVMEDFYNNMPSESSSSSLINRPLVGARVCIETSIPGVFRCHRRKRSADNVVQMNEE